MSDQTPDAAWTAGHPVLNVARTSAAPHRFPPTIAWHGCHLWSRRRLPAEEGVPGVRLATATVARRSAPERWRFRGGPIGLERRADVVDDVTGIGHCIQRSGVRGKALQHAAETRALGVRERAEHVLFDFPQTLLGLSAPLLPLPGGHDVPAAAIQRIGAPLHQAGFLEIVDQIGHHRAIDAQSLRQRTLAAGLVLHRRDQHLVAARSAGDVAHHGMRRIEVRTENHAQREPQVLVERGWLRTSSRGGSCRRAHYGILPRLAWLISKSYGPSICALYDLPHSLTEQPGNQHDLRR